MRRQNPSSKNKIPDINKILSLPGWLPIALYVSPLLLDGIEMNRHQPQEKDSCLPESYIHFISSFSIILLIVSLEFRVSKNTLKPENIAWFRSVSFFHCFHVLPCGSRLSSALGIGLWVSGPQTWSSALTNQSFCLIGHFPSMHQGSSPLKRKDTLRPVSLHRVRFLSVVLNKTCDTDLIQPSAFSVFGHFFFFF